MDSFSQESIQQNSSLARKCPGKSREHCLQVSDHPNSRWECAFETQNQEQFKTHVKNVYRRTRWRDLIASSRPDASGYYHCVYFSTDRNHVENHFHKTTPEHQITKLQMKEEGSRLRKRSSSGFGEIMMDDNMQHPMNQSEKKYRNDSGLLDESELSPDKVTLPDNTKTEELMDNIEKRLEIPHEIIQFSLDKLHKHGFVIVAALKALTRESWIRLELPLAIEEELKNQLYGRVSYTALPVQMYTWSQPLTGQQVYFPSYFEHSEVEQQLSKPEDVQTNTSIYTHEKLEMLDKSMVDESKM